MHILKIEAIWFSYASNMDWERQGVLAWVAESNWKDAAAIKWDGKDRERNRFAKENKNLSVLDRLNLRYLLDLWASLVAQMVKHLPAMPETWVRFLGWEDPLEKEMAIHSSTLAWKIPWTEEPDRLQSTGSQRVGHDWATSLSLSLFIRPPSGDLRKLDTKLCNLRVTYS